MPLGAVLLVVLVTPQVMSQQESHDGDVEAEDPARPGEEGLGDDFDFDAYPVELDPDFEVVVSDERPEEEGLSRARIEREEIRRRAAQTAAEVVEHEVSVFAASGKKGQRTLRLRGFDQRGVNVYMDGVPFVSPYGGSVDLGKIPSQMLGGVLLLKGPTSIVHAPGGLGGALLLETRDPAKAPVAELELELNRDSERRLDFYHGYDPGPFSYFIGGGVSGSEGYRLSSQFEPTYYEDGDWLDNSDRKMRHAEGKLMVPTGDAGRFQASVFTVDGEFGIPRSVTDNRPFFSRFEYWRAAVGQVLHELEVGPLELTEAFYVAAYDNRLSAFDDETYATQDGPNAYTSWYHDRTFGGRMRAQLGLDGLPGGRTFARVWFDARRDSHRSRSDVDELSATVERSLVTAVPELEIPLVKRLVLTGSVQMDMESRVEGDDVPDDESGAFLWSPLLMLKWDPDDVWMLRLTGARRGRIPTLSERYSERLGYTMANPELQPEVAWHVGLDVSADLTSWLRAQLSLFDAEVEDLISSEYVEETNGVTRKENVGRARLMGAEAQVVFSFVDELELKAAYAYLHAGRLDDPEEDRIAQIPAHQAAFAVVFRPLTGIEASTSMRVVGPQAFDDYTILGLGELGTYAVWDARVELSPLEEAAIWFKATNLLDMNYQTSYGYPDRGISFWIGARIKVDP